MTARNSADPACCSSNPATAVPAAVPAPASPMEVDDLLELEEITMVGGLDDHLLEAGPQAGHHEGHGEGRRHRHRDRAPKEAPRRSRRDH